MESDWPLSILLSETNGVTGQCRSSTSHGSLQLQLGNAGQVSDVREGKGIKPITVAWRLIRVSFYTLFDVAEEPFSF